MGAIAGYKGSVRGQTAPAVAFTDSPMSDTSTTRLTYRIDDTTKRLWDRNAAVTVEVSTDGGATWTPATGYTIQYLGGKVTFGAAQPAGALVRVDASAIPTVEFAGFTKWSADLETDMLEDTQLSAASDGAKTYTPGATGGTVSGEGFWVDGWFYGKLLAGGVAILQLLTGDGAHIDVQTYVNKVSPAVDVSGLVEDKREFQISGDFYYSTD